MVTTRLVFPSEWSPLHANTNRYTRQLYDEEVLH
jgi:hypothetical protein